MPVKTIMKRHRMRSPILLIVIILTMTTLNICILFAAQDVNQPIRVRIFSMHNISAQQAKQYLTESQIDGTAVAIPGTNAISMTANPKHLVLASNILKLVDVNEQFDVKFLAVEPGKTIPTNEAIKAKLGKGYSVSNLLEGPVTTEMAVKLIIDSRDNTLLIISSKNITEKVIKTIEELQRAAELKPLEKKSANGVIETQAETKQIASQALPEANDLSLAKKPKIVKTETSAEAKTPKPQDDDLGEFMNELSRVENSQKSEIETKLPKEIEQPKQSVEELIAPEPNVKNLKAEQNIQIPEVNEYTAEKTENVKTPLIRAVDIPNGDEVLELNLPEKLEIVTLIDLVGRYLNLNYLYDDTKVTGNVTIKVQGKIRVRELYSLLESVLKFRGFSMSRKENLVTIVPIAEALDQDPKLVDGVVEPGDIAVTKVFNLQHVSTATAKNLLTQMKLGSNITEIPETGTLVITEYAFRMQRIEDLLDLVDVPGPPKDFKLRVLRYTLAESLVTKIKSLAEQLGTVEVTVGTAGGEAGAAGGRVMRSPRPMPTASGPPAGQTQTMGKGAYVDFDKRTNRILMIGLESELSAVDKIIDSLDVPQQDLRIVREYEIQYVDIEKIIEALKEMNIIESAAGGGTSKKATVARQGQPGEGSPPPTPAASMSEGPTGAQLDQPQVVMLESTNSILVNATPEQHIQIAQIISYIDREPIQTAIPYRIYRLENQEPEALAEVLNGLIEKTTKDAQGKIQQTVKYTEDNIVIVPDKNTFSLIVYASRKNQEWIGSLIQSLDRRRPQVLIDVSLVEITRDDKFQYDLDVVANATDVVSKSIAIKPSTINTVFPPTTTPTPTNKLFEGGYFAASGKDSVTKGFFNAGRIQALLDLIDKNDYGRVLARPKVLVNDNEEGLISTEDTRYVGQTTSTTVAGTATASSDSVVQSTTFTPYTAKIELKITPQISEGNLLRLEVAMQRNDFQEGTGTIVNDIASPLNEKKSSINTIVTVPDGSTIILGGLTKLNQDKLTNKVPLLGDIPIAGTLFRSASRVATDSKLYIFVKANILRPELTEGLDQLKEISRKNKMEFERAESKFQNKQLIPGIKDEPIDPKHVLEQ